MKDGTFAGGWTLLGRAAALMALVTATPTMAADGKGQLLTTQFGELCTMCTATLQCGPEGGAQTTYAFGTRTFLSQMSTVLDYVPGLSDQAKVHSRPVTITIDGKRVDGTAKFNFRDARIDLPDAKGAATWIDRSSGAWHGAGESLLGRCTVPAAPSAAPATP